MPKVSVIIPVYNVEKYLRQCLDSVVNQTLKDIEIICIDDGGKDNCPQIIDEYASKDNRIVAIHKENGGYASAINYGLKIAKGEYIGIVESDDWASEDMYEKLYTKAKSLDSDITKGAFYCVYDSKNMKMYDSDWLINIAKKHTKNFSLHECPELIGNSSSIWSAIYKREWLRKNNIKMDESIRPYEDVPFATLAYAHATKITLIQDKILYYRKDAQNSSNNAVKKTILNYVIQHSKKRDILIKNNLFDGDIKEQYWKSTFCGCFAYYIKPNNIYKKQFYYRMKNLFKKAKKDNCKFKYFSKKDKKMFLKILYLPYSGYLMFDFLQQLFSIKNDKDKKHKVMTFLGIKIKFRRKKHAKS